MGKTFLLTFIMEVLRLKVVEARLWVTQKTAKRMGTLLIGLLILKQIGFRYAYLNVEGAR